MIQGRVGNYSVATSIAQPLSIERRIYGDSGPEMIRYNQGKTQGRCKGQGTGERERARDRSDARGMIGDMQRARDRRNPKDIG